MQDEEDRNTRDMAVRAFTTIDNHIKTCDMRYGELKEFQSKTWVLLNEIKSQMDTAKGAGMMAKLIMGGISGAMGLIGGIGSHLIIK